MSNLKYFIFFMIVLSKLKVSGEDTEVSCVLKETCILPCSFQVAPHVIIRWTHLTGENRSVHTYYENQDQLENQDQIFRNRTSLFKDQISRGNASLQLTEVEVQDEGKYECFTNGENGEEDSYIYVKVKVRDGEKKWIMNTTTWILIAVPLIAGVVAVGLWLYYKMKKGQEENNTRRSNSEETTCMKLEDKNEGWLSNEEPRIFI